MILLTWESRLMPTSVSWGDSAHFVYLLLYLVYNYNTNYHINMDKQAILNGSYFSLDEKSEMKFRLVYRNWNDYGYYTLYVLELKIPEMDISYQIADIRVMNIGQKKGDKPSWIPTTPIVFISNVESAEKLLLFLTPKQRSNLEKILLIQYDTIHVNQEEVFQVSVLRDKTLTEFNKSLIRIKELVQSPIDVSSMIDNHKTQLTRFLEDTVSPK